MLSIDHNLVLPEAETIQTLLAEGYSSTAAELYATNDSLQTTVVEAALDEGKFSLAYKYAGIWKLKERYPELDKKATRDRLLRIVRRGKAHLAA